MIKKFLTKFKQQPHNISLRFSKQLYSTITNPIPSTILPNLTHHKNTTTHSQLQQALNKQPSDISISKLIKYSTLNKKGLTLLNNEICNILPTILASCINDLQKLPYNLSNTKSIKKLIQIYYKKFSDINYLIQKKNNGICNEVEFINVIEYHFSLSKNAVFLIQNGLNECCNIDGDLLCPALNMFIDEFHKNRIKLRMFCGQYIQLYKQLNDKNCVKNNCNVLGLIDFECSPKEILIKAINEVTNFCKVKYGKSPYVNINNVSNIKIPYIADQLYYIFFEILKNSMIATIEYHNNNIKLPNIDIVIVGNNNTDDITIKISDQGGGISLENINKIFYYSFTTHNNDSDIYNNNDNILNYNEFEINTIQPIMNGFGYGLPLSKLYAKCFGGDINIASMHGYGTDVFIYLNKIRHK